MPVLQCLGGIPPLPHAEDYLINNSKELCSIVGCHGAACGGNLLVVVEGLLHCGLWFQLVLFLFPLCACHVTKVAVQEVPVRSYVVSVLVQDLGRRLREGHFSGHLLRASVEAIVAWICLICFFATSWMLSMLGFFVIQTKAQRTRVLRQKRREGHWVTNTDCKACLRTWQNR